MSSWAAWKMDWWTIAWIAWILAFFALETWTLANRSHNELTAHLRPLVQSAPPAWFLTFGLWLWLGQHFLWVGMDWRGLFRA